MTIVKPPRVYESFARKDETWENMQGNIRKTYQQTNHAFPSTFTEDDVHLLENTGSSNFRPI